MGFTFTTYPTYLKPVIILQKRIARIMTLLEPVSHLEPLLKFLNLLKFNDIIHSEILCFVHQWFHNLIPSWFLDFFKSISSIRVVSYTSVTEWKFIYRINSNYPIWYSLPSLHWFQPLKLTINYYQADNFIF